MMLIWQAVHQKAAGGEGWIVFSSSIFVSYYFYPSTLLAQTKIKTLTEEIENVEKQGSML